MSPRTDRLERLLGLQEKLRRLHETRQAAHVAAAGKAHAEAIDIAARFDAPESIAPLFPELYNRRISAALDRERASLEKAEAEARRQAEAKLRTERVEEQWRASRGADERKDAETDALEIVERRTARSKSEEMK